MKHRPHRQTAHDMEVQGVRFRQARILKSLPAGDIELSDDPHMRDIVQDKLTRALLGEAVGPSVEGAAPVRRAADE